MTLDLPLALDLALYVVAALVGVLYLRRELLDALRSDERGSPPPPAALSPCGDPAGLVREGASHSRDTLATPGREPGER